MTTLAERLRALRESLEMSQEKLADRAGISKTYLWELERGQTQGIGAAVLHSLACVLGVTMDELYPDPEPDALPWAPISGKQLDAIIKDTNQNPPGGMSYCPHTVYCMARELKMRRRA